MTSSAFLYILYIYKQLPAFTLELKAHGNLNHSGIESPNRKMNCIDAIEGTVKDIIDQFYNDYLENYPDDTEFIRHIKSVIDATEKFVKKNRELISEPEMLSRILYDYAKKRWMENFERYPEAQDNESDDVGYHDYYFDYIFTHGGYPR